MTLPPDFAALLGVIIAFIAGIQVGDRINEMEPKA